MKAKKTLKITAFILVMIMLALFSVGTILMSLPKKQNIGEGIAQFRVSGVDLKLEKFNILTPTVDVKETLKIDLSSIIETRGAKIDGYSLWAKEVNTGAVYYSSCVGESGDFYYSYSAPVDPGTYKVTGLTAHISAGTDYYTYYINLNDENNCEGDYCTNISYLKDKTFTLVEKLPDETPFYEYIMSFTENLPEAFVGDKLSLGIQRSDPNDEINMQRRVLKTMMLSYTNINTGDIVNMYVKSVNYKPYIIIPSTATPGRYVLNYGYLTFWDGSTAKCKNTNGKTFAYQSDFIVKEKEFDTSKYMFANEMYGNNVKTDLDKLDRDAIITIDANKAPLISEEIFESIKGTSRTLIIEYDTSEWVFSGVDIKNPKAIDVSTLVFKLEKSNEYYNEFMKTNVTAPSALVKFSDNGDLPGKVLIKIDSYSINEYLKNPNSVYVYYYKEDADQLLKVAMEIQKNDDGFYEFYINHNSKYIISSKEIKSKVVSDDVEMLALNGQKPSATSFPLVYVLATACGVLAILLLIVSLSKGRKQSQQQTQES